MAKYLSYAGLSRFKDKVTALVERSFLDVPLKVELVSVRAIGSGYRDLEPYIVIATNRALRDDERVLFLRKKRGGRRMNGAVKGRTWRRIVDGSEFLQPDMLQEEIVDDAGGKYYGYYKYAYKFTLPPIFFQPRDSSKMFKGRYSGGTAYIKGKRCVKTRVPYDSDVRLQFYERYGIAVYSGCDYRDALTHGRRNSNICTFKQVWESVFLFDSDNIEMLSTQSMESGETPFWISDYRKG